MFLIAKLNPASTSLCAQSHHDGNYWRVKYFLSLLAKRTSRSAVITQSRLSPMRGEDKASHGKSKTWASTTATLLAPFFLPPTPQTSLTMSVFIFSFFFKAISLTYEWSKHWEKGEFLLKRRHQKKKNQKWGFIMQIWSHSTRLSVLF